LDIPRSKVYLTLGTIEQIFFALGARADFFYEPTTEEIRKAIEAPVLFSKADIIIWPKSYTATGTIKRTGVVKNDSSYAIPTDQFVRPARGKRIFIVFCGLDGIVTKEQQAAAKKIQGGCFELLDLRTQVINTGLAFLDDGTFPITALHKAKQYKLLGGDPSFYNAEQLGQKEFALIDSLTTKEGVKTWGSICSKDIFKLFFIPGFRVAPILAKSRAWALAPFLNPFLTRIEEEHTCTNPTGILQEFAFWVYATHNYWSTSAGEGLHLYHPPKKLPYFVFKPSSRAKQEWLATIEGSSLAHANCKAL
jgi:hypothetical protein